MACFAGLRINIEIGWGAPTRIILCTSGAIFLLPTVPLTPWLECNTYDLCLHVKDYELTRAAAVLTQQDRSIQTAQEAWIIF